MHSKVVAFLKSSKLLKAAVTLFVLQGLFLSIVIPYKAPSDEEYHFRFTQYYAHRSILAGPVIADQTDNFDLGDIQRPPGYLYHYLSSFVLRAVEVFTASTAAQVIVLRFINVGMGALTLLMVIRLLRRLDGRGVTVNLTVAWLACTTMFVWLFAGLNYDNLAIVWFFVLLHLALSLYEKLNVNQILLMIATTLALMITKETFLPVILIIYLLLAFGLLRKKGFVKLWRQLIQSVQASWKQPKSRLALVGLSILVVVMFGLVGERYGQNYLTYQRTTPACNKVHTEAECMQHGIYRRNTGQRREYAIYLQNGGKPDMNFAEFAVKWTRLIFERTYSYRGMNTVRPTNEAQITALVTAPVVFGLAIAGWRKRRYSTVEKALAILTVAYSVLVFMYNYNIYHYYGYPFAIQGRYLLPVLPFIYYFLITGLLSAYGHFAERGKRILVTLLVVLGVLNILLHSPITLYIERGEMLRRPITISRSTIA